MNVEKLYDAMKRHKLKVNCGKSSTTVVSRAPKCNMKIDRVKVNNVKEMVYLGVKLS